MSQMTVVYRIKFLLWHIQDYVTYQVVGAPAERFRDSDHVP